MLGLSVRRAYAVALAFLGFQHPAMGGCGDGLLPRSSEGLRSAPLSVEPASS
jgi:hypothetical protein